MKKLLLSITASALLSTGVFAQTTAQDWTKTDCASASHNLFSYLDNFEVVVMEFGMGCSSCSTAANYLINTLRTKYDASHPGKVKFFYLDYWTGNTCPADVQPMLNGFNFHAGFDNCMAEKNYYMTGSPMPAIVIAAGPAHTVIYEKNSFNQANDTTNIRTAIDNALISMSVPCCNNQIVPLTVSPNPSNGVFVIESGFIISSVSVFDITGKEVYTSSYNSNKINIDLTGMVEKGIYFAEITINGKKQVEKIVVE